MAKTFGIGRPTARQATEALIRKGMLVRRRGSGTYVREQSSEVDLFSLGGTLASFHRGGVSITAKVLHPIRLVPVSKQEANPFDGGNAYFFRRLTRAEGTPVLVENIYLHPVLFRGIDRLDLTGRSLSQVVEEKFYMRPEGGKQQFRVGYPDRELAKRLEIPTSMPILTVQRYLNFPQAANGVYSALFCRTDKFLFSQTIGGQSDENSGIL